MDFRSYRVKAVYEYSSPHDDDLNFPNGQIITVTDEEGADWYFGEYTDSNGTKQEGLFPRNFVERYEPETPPRPTRSRKEREVAAPPPQAEPVELEAPDNDELEHQLNTQVRAQPTKLPADDPPPPQEPSASQSKELSDAGVGAIPPMPQQNVPKRQQSQKSATKPTASASTNPTSRTASEATLGPSVPKPAPPPVVEKPTGSSFKDRIAAFNKPAGPVAPAKPVGLGQPSGSGFVKKSFVAPPPSKNAYVAPPREPPPQKVYRREEEVEVPGASSNRPVNESDSTPSTEHRDAEDEDQPKPTSLKERIALLQKQQMEQAARQAQGGQKKEKPKKPPKKRTESDHTVEASNDGAGQSQAGRESVDVPRDTVIADEELSGAPGKDRILAKVPSIPSHVRRDADEADQRGPAEIEEGDTSAEHDGRTEKTIRRAPTMDQGTRLFGVSGPSIPTKEEPLEQNRQPSKVPEHDNDNGEEGEEDEEEEEGEDDEEEEVDPEVRRRQEIRERMAKMSGGMGMAGMFGAPMGFSPMASKGAKPAPKQKISAEREPDQGESMAPRMLPIPGMALPGMQRPKEPRTEETEVAKESDESEPSISGVREPDDIPDVEEVGEQPKRQSKDIAGKANVASTLQDQPTSAPPPPTRAAAPPVPGNRPPPDVPSNTRPAPAIPAQQPISPTAGSESDDELVDARQPPQTSDHQNDSQPSGRAPPPPPPASRVIPSIPSRPPNVQSPESQPSHRSSVSMASPKSPKSATSATFAPNRSSRVPPIPPTMADHIGGPHGISNPPAPPSQPPIPRRPTGDRTSFAPPAKNLQDSEEEVTGYDGDYGTDTTSSMAHRDALTSQDGDSSMDEPLIGDEASYHHLGLPSLGLTPAPGPSAPPRAVPPPPPNQPPKLNRQSSDMPRAAPPPPPPAPAKELIESDSEGSEEDVDDFIPPPPRPMPTIPVGRSEASQSKFEEEPSEYDSPQSPQSYRSPPVTAPPAPYEPPSKILPPERPMPRQSVEIPPNNSRAAPPDRPMPQQSLDVGQSTNPRRSVDTTRPAGDSSCIAGDIDVGRASQWWMQRKMPPPIFQNRIDVLYEIEEIKSNQAGSSIVVKEVYALFMDYSQTVVTARFDTKDPTRADLQQRHEPPPARLRQDQLEAAYNNYGARIAKAATAKLNTTIGDGSPSALINDLFHAFLDALPPVGLRSYGALVYANLANATVQQNDEIRAGDIVSFRNAKLQGHRGPVKQKYSVEVGKPDHVGVVVDWDGTKKKIRAWEQGREGKKVKVESFKLGDLRSGEVKVWRIMPRSWVGWGSPT